MSSASLSALSIKPLGLVDSLAANNVVPNTQRLISASGSANCRKRRAGLQPIDLSNCSKKKIGGSNETLTGTTSGNEADALQTQTDSEDCGTDLEDGEESLKRLRLRSQSPFSSTPDGTQLLPSPEWHGSQELLGLHDSSEIKNIRKFQPNLAELEGNQGSSGDASTSSPRHAQLSSSGLLLEDELRGSKYELVGDGRTCKAVEMADDQKNVVWHCQIIKLDEFRQINEIMNRMQKAAMDYEKEEFSMISNLLLPIDNLRIICSPQRRGLVYMLLPDHYGTLHQLLEENELCCLSGGPARLGEERAQPILKQVAFLLEFCHRIGLYFRDFRLRKFVFTDSERTKIRVNNVLDLYLAPETKTDSFISREFIPAYVAPELIDKKNEQSGGEAADIWAFGVLIFTLLNGRYPFFESSPSPIALLRRIRAHRFSFPIHETISESARWLIHALLCQKPEDRPMAFQLLQAHWFRINHNSLVDKLAEQTDRNGEKGILERAKATSPTTAFFHLSSPAPVSTVYGLIRTSPPIGQVPASRRLISPITTLVGNNTEVESPYHRVLPHSTMVLDQQQPITSLTNQIRGVVTSKTVLESRQQSGEHSINRRRQPPAFVPISTFSGPPTIRDGRQLNAHRRQLLLIPANLAMNSFRISGSRTERETPRKKKQPDEASENKDQIVPESMFTSGN